MPAKPPPRRKVITKIETVYQPCPRCDGNGKGPAIVAPSYKGTEYIQPPHDAVCHRCGGAGEVIASRTVSEEFK